LATLKNTSFHEPLILPNEDFSSFSRRIKIETKEKARAQERQEKEKGQGGGQVK